MNRNVLISHAYNEKELAEAWKTLIENVTLGTVEVWFSSDQHATGGVSLGKDWRDDLNQRLKASHFILAIQTPSSSSRPWVMWECGAASSMGEAHGIIPIVYSIGRGELANPLSTYQVYSGEDSMQIREVCARLGRAAGLKLATETIQESHIQTYLDAINAFHPRKIVSAEQMNTWRQVFEQLLQEGRTDEVADARQRMYASFVVPFQPVDPTIHFTLSKELSGQKKLEEARDEIDYALRLDKDNIQFLHQKILILIELRELHSAEEIIESVFKLKKELRMDQEFAALEGRIHREHWILGEEPEELDKALAAYQRAYELDKTHRYYAGINFAELALAKGDISLAEQTLQDVLTVCRKLQAEPHVSYWVDFTAGNAYMGLGNAEVAISEYRKGFGRKTTPSLRERESAAKGAQRMAKLKKMSEKIMEEAKELFQV